MGKKNKNKKKWSTKFFQALIGVWNCWSISNERFSYCDDLKYDILGLTELHNNQTKELYQGRRWVCSAQAETDKKFLKDWQAGFRKARGTRDNITILRTLCKDVLQLGKSLTINFVDYAAAFDSVSHKFLDKALARAGASNKMRAMSRAIYRTASVFTTVSDADGNQIKTDEFPIKRGVLQGDIMSPLFFIIDLEFILRDYDNV